MEDVLERRKKGGGGENIFLKNSKFVVETHIFSWWELLPNMPGMQSLKALLLFVKEQCGFSSPLHHHRSCVLIPFIQFSSLRVKVELRYEVTVRPGLGEGEYGQVDKREYREEDSLG